MAARYNYLEAVMDDVSDYIETEVDLTEWTGNRRGFERWLYDELFASDYVTGNASRSYTFNSYTAEEYISHNLGLLDEALAAFGSDPDYLLKNGAEAADVTVRCYLLGHAIAKVLNEMEDDGAFDED